MPFVAEVSLDAVAIGGQGFSLDWCSGSEVFWGSKHHWRKKIQIGGNFFGFQENERHIYGLTGLFLSGGRNTERGMIALWVQDPAARHEEARRGKSVGLSAFRRVHRKPC
jgi:hypothetical protein